MTTSERADALASCARSFAALLGSVKSADLLEVVRLELGHAGILDGFCPYGSHQCRAIPPGRILHVISGNTPHAGLQSVMRGLLLGSHNLIKIPSSGLPELVAFCEALPPELAACVELANTLQESWLSTADAVVVFGDDETVAHFRRRVRADVPFQAHGHRVSLAIVFDDPDCSSVNLAARDISLHDQQGCLSPHDIYVDESSGISARTYAARLAEAMGAFDAENPRRPLAIGESAAIADLRASYSFRAAGDVRTQIWCSENSTNWTVVYEEDAWFATSPLNRFVFVKPLPSDLTSALAPVSPWLAAIGIYPAIESYANRLASLGAARLCPLGRMQFPPFSWHTEGAPNLANLVRWVDFEPNSS